MTIAGHIFMALFLFALIVAIGYVEEERMHPNFELVNYND